MKKILLLLTVSVLIISCSKERENPPLGFDGSWQMTQILSFSPDSPTVINDNIYWKFDEENQKVNVINPIAGDYALDEGEYDIIIQGNKITINSTEYGFVVGEETLTLSDEPELDGPTFKFIKL